MSTEKCRLIQLFLRIPALKPSNKYEIDLRTQLHGFFFLFSLYAFPPKGALGYEADNFMGFFFFFFESIRLSPEGSLRL